MANYRISSLNGALRQVKTSCELLEAVLPLAELIVAEAPEACPVLFFITQDGEDGQFCFTYEAKEKMDKDQMAYAIRSFCAESGVKGCVIFYMGRVQWPDQSSWGEALAQGGNRRPQPPPEGSEVAMLSAEFLGCPSSFRVCSVDRSEDRVSFKDLHVEHLEPGRFRFLLGQGEELGYPVSDELLDQVVRLFGKRARHSANVQSVVKGRTAGEAIFLTPAGPMRIRVVEKEGKVFLVSLFSGKATWQADKAKLIAALDGTSL